MYGYQRFETGGYYYNIVSINMIDALTGLNWLRIETSSGL
jgi:hypothetical protein